MQEEFLHEFYNLFFINDNKFFIGSREQARMLLQLKLNKYIPMALIDRAFNVFKSAGLIEKKKKKQKIDMQIGEKVFKLYPQNVYERINVANIEQMLKSLYKVFNDIDSLIDEVVSDEDIQELRRLENEKNTVIKEHLSHRDRCEDYSDLGLSYGVSKTMIKKYIEILNKYNPCEAEEIREKEEKERIQRQNAEEKIRKGIINDCFNLLKANLELDGVLQITLSSLQQRYCMSYWDIGSNYGHSVALGVIQAKNVIFDNDTIKINEENSNFAFTIEKSFINVENRLMIMVGYGIKLTIRINEALKEQLIKLSPYC